MNADEKRFLFRALVAILRLLLKQQRSAVIADALADEMENYLGKDPYYELLAEDYSAVDASNRRV